MGSLPASKDNYPDTPWHLLRWDAESECVFSEWKGFATSIEFRAGWTGVLLAINEHAGTRYVSDARGIKVIVTKDQEWVCETWLPLAEAAGLRRFALVMSAVGFGQTAVAQMLATFHSEKVEVQVFGLRADALAWIQRP